VLASLVVEVIARPSVARLTYVPGDHERARERGHVPAARLAEALGVLWDVPVQPLLERASPTPRQAGLPRRDRLTNVRWAFRASGIPPPDVALVDDVYTTGATAAACARALRRAGARRVEVVCLARAVR
jgi:predicted amidophosphoribosyltransferase